MFEAELGNWLVPRMALGSAEGLSVGPLQLRGGVGYRVRARLIWHRSLRPSSNGQLRTGTDLGNPTV